MPKEARELILNAAEARLLRAGPSGLVLDAIAADAGVSKGGLLYHFANKEALVAALCSRMLEGFDASLAGSSQADAARRNAPLTRSKSPEGANGRDGTQGSEASEGERPVGRFARAYLASTVTDEGKPADNSAQLMAGLLAILGRDSAHLKAVRARFLEWHEAFSQDGLDDATATIVRLAADGLWLSALLGLPQLDPDLGRRTLEALREMTEERASS